MPSDTDIRSIADLGNTCPELGLAAHHDPAWHYAGRDADYNHHFVLVGERILISEPSGNPNLQDVQHVLMRMQRVMERRLASGQKFVHISNFAFTRATAGETRQLVIRHFQHNDRLAGIIFFNVSPFYRLSIKLAQRLRVYPFKVHIASSYADAMRQARRFLEKPTSESPPRPTPASPDDAADDSEGVSAPGNGRAGDKKWELVLGANYTVRFEMPSPGVFEVISIGALEESHVTTIFERHEEIFRQCGLEDGNYYYVSDVTKLHRATLKARRLYYDHIRAWYDRHPFRAYVFYGVNRFIRAAIDVARHFVDFQVVIVKAWMKRSIIFAGPKKNYPCPWARSPRTPVGLTRGVFSPRPPT